MKKNIYKIFLTLCLIPFIIIFFGTIFDNKAIETIARPSILLIGVILTVILFITLFKILNKKIDENMSKKKEIIIFSIIFLLILISELVVAIRLVSYPGWDWNDLYENSRLFADHAYDDINWEYFQRFPNNNLLFYCEILLFKFIKILGGSMYNIPFTVSSTIIVNLFFINLSIILIYFTLRNLLGKKYAIYGLILTLFSNAIYCYLPVLYTDTISMLFPVLILFCYSVWNKNKSNKKLSTFLFIVIGISTAIGIKFKFTIIIMLIAIIIDMIMENKFNKIIKPIIIIFITLILSNSIYGVIETKLNIFPYDINNNNKAMPYSHWIMMGMTERETKDPRRYYIGWYNPDSMEYTLSYETTQERKKANIKKIKEQYNNYGFIEYVKFLYRKMLYTWSDGKFFSRELVGCLDKNKHTLTYQFYAGKYQDFDFYKNTAYLEFLYLLIILGIIKSMRNNKNKVNSCYLALCGLIIFFLIWESSSRYVVHFIPIIIIGATYGLSFIINKYNKEEKKEKEINNEKRNEKVLEVLKMKKSPILYVVVPCYNEEEVLHETTKRMKEKLNKLIKDKSISEKSKVMYVNDGSKDKTWEIIKEINKKEKLFTGICLSRNRGHQNALLAGLMTARNYADIVISMDADLQDDINAIDGMIKKYQEGNDIVYGVRSSRKKDTWFKKTTAEGFYKVMKLLGVDIVFNHADYRLTSKRVLDEFSNFKEVNLFLRGMFPLIGFKSDVVYYERNERFAGESKYPLKKMLNFAWDGITSFSVKPLRFICTTGFLILIVSIGIMIYSLIQKIIGNTVEGWTFLSISIWFIGGLQMISIGIIGEYIGKMYNETKARPRFIISENLEENK